MLPDRLTRVDGSEGEPFTPSPPFPPFPQFPPLPAPAPAPPTLRVRDLPRPPLPPSDGRKPRSKSAAAEPLRLRDVAGFRGARALDPVVAPVAPAADPAAVAAALDRPETSTTEADRRRRWVGRGGSSLFPHRLAPSPLPLP